jgi:lipoprotein-anchoring transpeptidase ErfK/SrfK
MTLAAIGCGILVVLALAMYVYDHSRRDLIAKGVTIAGVNVGGLHEHAAIAKVSRELGARLDHPVYVHLGSHRWVLDPRRARLTLDVPDMVGQAVSASRGGSIFSRTFRGVFGGRLKRDIPLAVTYSHAAIAGLTADVRAGVNRAPRDAAVEPSATGLSKVPGRDGLKVDSDRLGARIQHALIAGGPGRSVTVPFRRIRPKVTIGQLAARYPAYIIIDRSAFRLRFYHHLKLADTYEIAVGMEGLETPPGLHKIEWKEVNPAWHVPDKAWAGSLAGTVVPPGPADPLKARFMSFEGGAGIHGIDPSEYSSIGQNASHGCVRMRIPDVIALYSKTPVGTPVYIA